MTAVFCQNTADRKAETWKKQLEPYDQLEFAVSDAAKGIAAAVEQVADARRGDESTSPLDHGLDVFHTAREAHRVLAQHWRRAEAAWDEAEAAATKVDRAKQQGLDARGPAQRARAVWQQATAAFAQGERLEAAWRRARAALDLFRPDGRLNDRATAEAEITAALHELPGPEWKKVRNFLRDRRSLAFLDRMHQRLATAEPRPEWRAVWAWRWWQHHRGTTAAVNPLTTLVHAVACQRPLTEDEQTSYDRIAAVLESTVRASSAVEGMNSVLRMHQSRHRRMTQPMLDLKRLYWNCRPFRSGPRRKGCPYQHLGLKLPSYDFWELLQSDLGQLAQELSTSGIAE